MQQQVCFLLCVISIMGSCQDGRDLLFKAHGGVVVWISLPLFKAGTGHRFNEFQTDEILVILFGC